MINQNLSQLGKGFVERREVSMRKKEKTPGPTSRSNPRHSKPFPLGDSATMVSFRDRCVLANHEWKN